MPKSLMRDYMHIDPLCRRTASAANVTKLVLVGSLKNGYDWELVSRQLLDYCTRVTEENATSPYSRSTFQRHTCTMCVFGLCPLSCPSHGGSQCGRSFIKVHIILLGGNEGIPMRQKSNPANGPSAVTETALGSLGERPSTHNFSRHCVPLSAKLIAASTSHPSGVLAQKLGCSRLSSLTKWT